jgi:putative membrane protein
MVLIEGRGDYDMMDDMSGWSWVWMSAVMVLFWGAVLVFGIWAVRSFADRGRSPLEIAGERYARGEITREQFEEIQRGLLGRPA